MRNIDKPLEYFTNCDNNIIVIVFVLFDNSYSTHGADHNNIDYIYS